MDEEIKETAKTLTLKKKKIVIKPLAAPIAELVEQYRAFFIQEKAEREIASIHVDEFASKVAFFYEKVRKIVDWKEENLVRRGAIERVLKRRLIPEISGTNFFIGNVNANEVAEPLVLELVRGGHFPNDKIPRQKIETVKKSLAKYVFLLEKNPLNRNNDFANELKIKDKINFYTWIIEIAACEIEEILAPPVKEEAMIQAMTRSMLKRLRVYPETSISKEENIIQTYIAVHRALFHLDDPVIVYHLLKKKYPAWVNPSQEELATLTEKVFQIKNEIEAHLKHPFSGRFFNICEKYDTIYLLLGDVLENFKKTPEKIEKRLSRPKKLKEFIQAAYEKRLATLKSRLHRSAVYSTLSIFVAGGASLYIFEVPLAKLFYGGWSPLATLVDILLPTVLMFLLVAIIRPPRPENLERVLQETKKVVYAQTETDLYELNVLKKRNPIIHLLVGLLYSLGSAVSLGFIFWLFEVAKVPATSLYIDTLNVAMIVFAALVIKQRSKELTIDEKAAIWEFPLDIFSIPLGKLGQWLSEKWKEYNIVSVFLIALVDMPFSTFTQFIESWSSYIKEKKAEIH